MLRTGMLFSTLQAICLANQEFRIPVALQWMFPTPLAILLWMAPESPWWLVRKGRYEEAERSVGRLGRKSRLNLGEAVSMMRRTIELEKTVKEPNYLELFKGTDLYRTLIVCGVYAAQNLTGNLIANQAVYFFERKSPILLIRPSDYMLILPQRLA
jgi:SP family general alpha glucoside:H+ symporter-like MFS transporter